MKNKPSDKQINALIAYLKGSELPGKDVMIQTLTARMTEKDVFQRYIIGAGENKDQDSYYHARDAAQYLSGSLQIEQFCPEAVASVGGGDGDAEPDYKALLAYVRSLEKRIRRLESKLNMRSEVNRATRKDASECSRKDLISQTEAIKLIGCSKSTIKRWANNGYIQAYTSGSKVLYSRSELLSSNVVINRELEL